MPPTPVARLEHHEVVEALVEEALAHAQAAGPGADDRGEFAHGSAPDKVGDDGSAEELGGFELLEDVAELRQRADARHVALHPPRGHQSTSSRMSCTVPTAE